MMSPRRVRFIKERETKNTVRYQEQPEAGKPLVIGTLYVQREALGTPIPDEVTVKIDSYTGEEPGIEN